MKSKIPTSFQKRPIQISNNWVGIILNQVLVANYLEWPFILCKAIKSLTKHFILARLFAK